MRSIDNNDVKFKFIYQNKLNNNQYTIIISNELTLYYYNKNATWECHIYICNSNKNLRWLYPTLLFMTN